ncbi:MAG: 4-hydroxy-tetrahydrodipicolinate reductase, partial [Actinomycetota bacterium]|nr:4-hydroxy-tetrahydrodipicolinate reductase [Actinomycetota bacterium]
MTNVGVLGAAGRMGREVCRAVEAADDLTLIAAVDPHHEGTALGNLVVAGSRNALEGADVAVDFTTPGSVMENARWCLGRGMHLVIGTTGIGGDGLEEIHRLAGSGNANAIVAPNFAIGAALTMRFAEQAARYFDAAEVIELHHDQKVDAPSGTAITTAQRIAAARAGAWEAPGGDVSH